MCVYFQSYPEELSFIGTPAIKEHEQDAKVDRRRIQGPVIIAEDGFRPPPPPHPLVPPETPCPLIMIINSPILKISHPHPLPGH